MKNIILTSLLAFSFVTPLTAWARPKTIILIRHGEEPSDPKDNSLSEAGRERAKALPTLFKTHPALKDLDDPVALFAAGKKNEGSSERSIQTLDYLSKALQVRINDDFKRDDFRALSEDILDNSEYDDKVVVVCWQHTILREIAEKLGVKNPPAYPSSRYDRLWVITYKEKEKKKKNKMKAVLEDFPQHLMPGDSKK